MNFSVVNHANFKIFPMVKYGRKNISGFTMIELIVSVSIIGILTAIFLANYHSYNGTADLNMSAQLVASYIRDAQNYALNLKEFGGAVPAGGWGIRLRRDNAADQLVVFADRDESRKYRSGEDSDPNDNESFQKILLAEGVIIDDFSSNNNYLYITYVAPEPTIHINFANNESNDNLMGQLDRQSAEITLRQISSGEIKKIIINKFGQVDIDN